MENVMKLFILLSLFVNSAFACTYFINEITAKKELTAVVEATLKAGNDNASVEAEIVSFKWFESISTPMCPEELTFEAELNVRKQIIHSSGYRQTCMGTVNIVKTEDWKTYNSDSYTVTGHNNLRCTR
jgi:hypothetical protein